MVTLSISFIIDQLTSAINLGMSSNSRFEFKLFLATSNMNMTGFSLNSSFE